MADVVSIAVPVLVEAAKAGLQLYFTNMRMAGKTDEEIDQLYQAEKAQAQINKPEQLEDV